MNHDPLTRASGLAGRQIPSKQPDQRFSNCVYEQLILVRGQQAPADFVEQCSVCGQGADQFLSKTRLFSRIVRGRA